MLLSLLSRRNLIDRLNTLTREHLDTVLELVRAQADLAAERVAVGLLTAKNDALRQRLAALTADGPASTGVLTEQHEVLHRPPDPLTGPLPAGQLDAAPAPLFDRTAADRPGPALPPIDGAGLAFLAGASS